MGRYANRFVAGGSNTIGATFTAADGGGNTAYAVAANGQSLSRTEYPGLARFYSGQTEFDTLKITAPATSTAYETWIRYAPYIDASYGGGQQAAYYSNFLLYKQQIQTVLPGLTGPYHAFWYTEDAENWKLVDFPARQIGSSAGLIVTTGGIYVCHDGGLHKTTNGTTFTDLYPSGVYTVADLGPTTVFVTGGTGIVKTNDFVNFTRVNIASGFTVRTLVVHSGVLYAFPAPASNATGVYYSTDTGDTWTKATSGTVTGVGYHVVSTGGYLVASTYTVSSNTPVFQYSTDPTGTTNTWTASTQTKSGADSDGSVYPTHVIYDSGTNNLVYCLQYRLDNSSGIFAYTFSGITGARLTYTGLGNNLVPFGIGTGNYQDTFAVNIGGKRGFCIGPLTTFLPNPSGTTWSGSFYTTANSTIENYRPNPFYHLRYTYTGGYYTLGTTNSGTRYIFKGTSANTSAIAQLGVFVEESGFFKPLKATSTGEFALIDTCGQASSYNEADVCLAEASGRYLLVFTSTGTSYSGVYYNSYSQSTRRSTATGGVYRGVSASTSILGATKSNGVYVFYSGSTQLQNSNQPLVLTVNPQGSVNFIQATNTFTGGYATYSFSNLTNNVVISATSTSGTTSGVAYTFDGSNFIRNDYTLLNFTGGIVTPLTGTHILQSNGKYYAVDPSGVIYKGTALTTLAFNNYTNRSPTGIATNGPRRYTEISQTRTIGNASIVVNDYAGLNFSQVHTSPDSANPVSNINRVDVWRFSGSTTYVINAANRWDGALAQTSGSGSFAVPNITGNVPGQAVYIIAR